MCGIFVNRFKLTEHMLSVCRCIVASFIPHFSASLLHQLDTTVSLETNLSFVMRAKLSLVCVLFMIKRKSSFSLVMIDVRETLHESNRSELNDSISKCSPEKESLLECLKDLLQIR